VQLSILEDGELLRQVEELIHQNLVRRKHSISYSSSGGNSSLLTHDRCCAKGVAI